MVKPTKEEDLEIRRAFRRVFCDDSDKMTQDGLTVLREIDRIGDWNQLKKPAVDRSGALDPYMLAMERGAREMCRQIRGRIFDDITPLKRQVEARANKEAGQ